MSSLEQDTVSASLAYSMFNNFLIGKFDLALSISRKSTRCSSVAKSIDEVDLLMHTFDSFVEAMLLNL